MAATLMEEVGIDIAGQKSKGLGDLPPVEFDVAVTMGCGDACPTLRARRREDWNIPDPKNMPVDKARAIRDDIRARVRSTLTALAAPQ